MITRRAFLTALACLPVIGKWMPPQAEAPLTRGDTMAGFGKLSPEWVEWFRDISERQHTAEAKACWDAMPQSPMLVKKDRA